MPTTFLKKMCPLIIGFLFINPSIGQEKYINPFGMHFIKVPSGEMIMGKFEPTVSTMPVWGSDAALNQTVYQEALQLADKAAQPGFKAIIKNPYYIGMYEVTQGQWKKIMHNNPSFFTSSNGSDDADAHPVEHVSWKMAKQFIKKLNQLDPLATYRLPTEFEWEYAARAGAQGDISWAQIQASAILASQTTSMIGQKAPNAWGIYDMLGNVWEWVEDYYNEKIFADPIPPTSGKQHVLKGASFFGDVKNATYMTHAAGPGSGYDVGIRLVMELKATKL